MWEVQHAHQYQLWLVHCLCNTLHAQKCSRFIMQYYSYLFWGLTSNGACTHTHRSFTQRYFSYSYISLRELFSRANKIPDSSGRYIFQLASWNNHCRLISCPWNSHLVCVLKINKNISNQSLASEKFWLSCSTMYKIKQKNDCCNTTYACLHTLKHTHSHTHY